jgi:hypothetical protein
LLFAPWFERLNFILKNDTKLPKGRFVPFHQEIATELNTSMSSYFTIVKEVRATCGAVNSNATTSN